MSVIFFATSGASVVNSGKYYVKSQANQKFFVTGEISLKRGVTNIVSLEME